MSVCLLGSSVRMHFHEIREIRDDYNEIEHLYLAALSLYQDLLLCVKPSMKKACENGDVKAVEALLEAEEPINSIAFHSGETPLSRVAARKGWVEVMRDRVEVVRDLLKRGAPQKVRDNYKKWISCLELALKWYFKKLVAKLRSIMRELIYSLPYQRVQLTKAAAIAALLCCTLSLKEVIGAGRGSAPPLNFMTRLINSKFWVMESDVWADLLIICRWANPTTTTVDCQECGDDVPAVTTSCNHKLCRSCTMESLKKPPTTCPECGGPVVNVTFLDTLLGTKRALEAIESAEEYSPSPKRKCIQELPNKGAGPVPPDVSYDIKDLDKLIEALCEAQNKWEFIGYQWGLSAHELDQIEHSCSTKGLTKCLLDMIKTRLYKGSLLHIEIVRALKAKTVGHGKLANNLKL